MQKTVYYCDECKKNVGDKYHISLGLNKGASGIAVPPGQKEFGGLDLSWRVERVESGFMHFCNGKCLGTFFDKMMKKVMSPPKRRKIEIPKDFREGVEYPLN